MASVETMEIRKEIEIGAPLEVSFAALLDELGPEGQMPDGKSLAMKLARASRCCTARWVSSRPSTATACATGGNTG